MIERLEQRVFLTVTITGRSLSPKVFVAGTDGPDTIRVYTDFGYEHELTLYIIDNGYETGAENASELIIDVKGGNDSVIIENAVTNTCSVYGGDGDDTLESGAADDGLVDGGPGDDVLRGRANRSSLYGGEGSDTIFGGGGDTVIGGPGPDELHGANSTLTYEPYDQGVLITLDGRPNDGPYNRAGPRVSIEYDNVLGDFRHIRGSFGPDYIRGDFASQALYGLAGNDSIDGGGGGDDTINGGAGDDVLVTWAGNDLLYGKSGRDTLKGGGGNDHLLGGPGNDWLYGRDGDDRLEGGSDDDRLFGGDGNDTLVGNYGADLFRGEGNIDMADYGKPQRTSKQWGVRVSFDGLPNDGLLPDQIPPGTDPTTLLSLEGDNVMPDVEEISGSGGRDFLVGNEFNNRLIGWGGSDTLWGGNGSDTLLGGDGADFLKDNSGRPQRDLLDGGSHYDTAWCNPRDLLNDIERPVY